MTEQRPGPPADGGPPCEDAGHTWTDLGSAYYCGICGPRPIAYCPVCDTTLVSRAPEHECARCGAQARFRDGEWIYRERPEVNPWLW